MEKNLDVTKPRYSGQILQSFGTLLYRSSTVVRYPKMATKQRNLNIVLFGKTVNYSLSSWSERQEFGSEDTFENFFPREKTSDDFQHKSEAFQEYSSTFRLTLYSTKTFDSLLHLRLQPSCQVFVNTKIEDVSIDNEYEF